MDKAYDRTPTLRARALRNDPTDAEKRIWQVIRNRQLSGVRFNRQVPIGPYICDFVSRTHKLIVEVDGGQHSDDKDATRTAYLQSLDYTLIRFWNHDVLQNIDGVVLTIEQALPQPLPRAGGE